MINIFLFWYLIQVEFSDESDTEANTQAEAKEKTDAPKKRTTTRRAAQSAKTVPDPPAESKLPKRQAKGRKTTALPRATSSEDDDCLIPQPAPTRRCRSRRELTKAEVETMEELDKMRTIDEESNEVLDMSIEELRTSDTEDNAASSKDISLYFEMF